MAYAVVVPGRASPMDIRCTQDELSRAELVPQSAHADFKEVDNQNE